MLAKVLSSTVIGIDAHHIEVEVDLIKGLPYFVIVGLPEASVKESRERVKSSICNSGYKFPYDRIIINLAPADIKKEGTGFDLPIALGILGTTEILPLENLSKYIVLGELSLDGRIKPVKGTLPAAIKAKIEGYKGIIIPFENRNEAAVIDDISVIPVSHLSEAVDFLRETKTIEPVKIEVSNLFKTNRIHKKNFSEIMGQEHAKRALEVAASGGHNLVMNGPPGSGKTMLAKRLPSILPPITFDEAIETTKIFSIMGMLENNQAIVTKRPFRSPHHTISDAGLIGGGSNPKPGEVSLAHNGVLFLDELPEFKKSVLEVLRQPLEDQTVTIARVASSITYPSSFMLVAAMNPCPCGYLSDPSHECKCTAAQIQKYQSKISGPLLDRIDIHVDVPAVPYKKLMETSPAEPSEKIKKRVTAARKIQEERFKRSKIFCNAQMSTRHIKKYCKIEKNSRMLLEKAIYKLGLSARAYNRILKISRTIADLDDIKNIDTRHISEAIQYRSLDRK